MISKIGQKGSISFALYFILLFVVLIFAFSLISPTLQTLTIQLYEANEFIIEDANAAAAEIDNNSLRETVQAGLQTQVDNTELNISVNSSLAQYAWAIILIMVVVTFILVQRSLVEVNRGVG